MKVEVGLFELMGARISVAFVDALHIDAGDDALLAKIWQSLRHLTTYPLMLYSNDGRGYAPYQTHEFAKRIRREHALKLFEIDLKKPSYTYQSEPPF